MKTLVSKINVHQPLSLNAVYTFTRTSRQGNVILSNRQACSSLDVGSEDYIRIGTFDNL